MTNSLKTAQGDPFFQASKQGGKNNRFPAALHRGLLITGVGLRNDSTESPHDPNQLSIKLKNYPFHQHRALCTNIPMLLDCLQYSMRRLWFITLTTTAAAAAALTSFIGV